MKHLLYLLLLLYCMPATAQTKEQEYTPNEKHVDVYGTYGLGRPLTGKENNELYGSYTVGVKYQWHTKWFYGNVGLEYMRINYDSTLVVKQPVQGFYSRYYRYFSDRVVHVPIGVGARYSTGKMTYQLGLDCAPAFAWDSKGYEGSVIILLLIPQAGIYYEFTDRFSLGFIAKAHFDFLLEGMRLYSGGLALRFL